MCQIKFLNYGHEARYTTYRDNISKLSSFVEEIMFLYEVDCLVFEIDKRSGQPRNAWQVLSLKIIDVFFLFWKFYSPSLFEGGG